MNVIREINKINELEINLGSNQASWHDDYKDSAYVHVSGLDFELTEGDVITIFSQYGEVMDINMPRDKNSGKPRGFAFLMYEDQRSTVLAVDNLNGANVRNRTLKVDHVKNYKQPKVKGESGELVEREQQSLNAKPELIHDDDAASESSVSSAPSIDPEDPMRDYILQKRKEEKAKIKGKEKGKSKKNKHANETPEERRARKQRKRAKKVVKDRKRAVFKDDDDRDRSNGKQQQDDENQRYRRRSSSPRLRRPSPRLGDRSPSSSPRRTYSNSPRLSERR